MTESNISSDWMDILLLDGDFELLMTWPKSRINILQAFEVTPFEEVKVVIIGEETWWWWRHKSQEDEIPPSMEIIFEELKSDFLHTPATYRCLKSWAKQGVLLLDVFQHDAGDDLDRAMAWEACIDNIVKKLNDREKQIAFILWGELAQSKNSLIDSKKHLVLSAPHPDPNYNDKILIDTLFFGSKPFSKANKWLVDHKETSIDWRMPYITNNWQNILEVVFYEDYFQELQEFLDKEYANKVINPERKFIFQALELTPFEKVKVVIVGQDPCPGENQSFGVAFSVPFGTVIPNTLDVIYTELKNDEGHAPVSHGCLDSWAKQGVLLLNSILTVRQGKAQAQSHSNHNISLKSSLGWETFTNAIIKKLNERENPIVFMLWGYFAKMKKKLITSEQHCVISTDHPAFGFHSMYRKSDFDGSKPFSRANEWLTDRGEEPINWKLPEKEHLLLMEED